MSTPADPADHERPRDLPEMDRPPAACAPPTPDPEALARTAVAVSFGVLALLTAGALVGGSVLALAALASAGICAVAALRVLPARHRSYAAVAGQAVVVVVVLLA